MSKPLAMKHWRSSGCFALLLAALSITGQVRAEQVHAPTTPLQSMLELPESEPTTVLPTIKAWKLRQNTKVLFVENHALPMIDVLITFAAGSNQDGNSPGLAAAVLSMFNEGSALKDANTQAKAFDALGVNTGNGIRRGQSYFTLRSLSASGVREPALQLFTEMLAKPGFTADGLRRTKNELTTLLKQQDEDPYFRALQLIYNELYPGQSLTRSMYGTVENIERIDDAQLRDFYRRAYTAANAQIVIVGDLSLVQAQILSRTLADALPVGPALADPPPIHSSVNTVKTHHLENDSTNSLLMLAQNALPNQHPDAAAIRAGNLIFSHILNEQLREKYSVTYGVLSEPPLAKSASPWIISVNTPPRYSLSAATQIKTLFARFLEDGPTKKELDTIKQHALRALPQLTASNLAIQNELALISYFNQPLSFSYETEKMQTITREQIKAAMNRHFSVDGWVSVTVGPNVEQHPLPEITRPGAVTDHICQSTN